MSLIVIRKGIFDCVEDTGRFGYRHWGINPGGVMDAVSAGIANAIVGNATNVPLLEMQFPAPILQFDASTIIAIAGANFSPQINSFPISMNKAILLQRGDKLSFQKPIAGRVAYLSVSGGLTAEKWLGSYATNLRLKQGGFQGRRLQVGDQLNLENPCAMPQLKDGKFTWSVNNNLSSDEQIFVLPSKDWNRLSDSAKAAFLNSFYMIAPTSDNMGFYLDGEKLKLKRHQEMLSASVDFGTIQLLPDGNMVVLMAQHQTSGGYPCIAHVISAHRSKLAQKPNGTKIHFALTNMETALELLNNQLKLVHQIRTACFYKWNK